MAGVVEMEHLEESADGINWSSSLKRVKAFCPVDLLLKIEKINTDILASSNN